MPTPTPTFQHLATENMIEKNFIYHPPKSGQPEKYTELRDTAKNFALLVNDLCPDGREKSLAITKIEEAIMWANAAIARE